MKGCIYSSIFAIMLILCGCLEQENQETYQDEEFVSWMILKAKEITNYMNLSVGALKENNLYLTKKYADLGYNYCVDTLNTIHSYKISDNIKEFYRYSYDYLTDAKMFFFYISCYAETQDVNYLDKADTALAEVEKDLDGMIRNR